MTRPPSETDHVNAIRADDEMLWERRYKIATMRNGGMTVAAIAERVGVAPSTVRKDISIVLHEAVSDSIEEMVARQRTVLADMQRAVYGNALRGEIDAVTTVLRVLDHEAKLFGLFAPSRVDVGVSDLEYGAQIAELITALRPDTIKELTRGHINGEVVHDDAGPAVTDGQPDDAPAPAANAEPASNGHRPDRPAVATAPPPDEPWSNL